MRGQILHAYSAIPFIDNKDNKEDWIFNVNVLQFRSETEALNKEFCILSKWFVFI